MSEQWTDGIKGLMMLQPGLEPIETTFELNDTLYAKAMVPPIEEVYLWLGANVMLAYPVAEAETLLEGRLSAARQTKANCEEDLEFLREQITVRVILYKNPHRYVCVYRDADAANQTLEVATARVYNWDVSMRRKEKEKGGSAEEDNDKRGLPNG